MVANYTEATALPHKMIEKEATQEHRCPFPDCKFLFKGKRWIPSERVNHFAHHICLNHVREDEEIFVADVRDQPACGWCGSRKGKCKTVKVLQKYQARCTSSLGNVSRKLPFMPKALNTLEKCPMVGCKEIHQPPQAKIFMFFWDKHYFSLRKSIIIFSFQHVFLLLKRAYCTKISACGGHPIFSLRVCKTPKKLLAGKVLATHPPPPGGCVHVMKLKEADDLSPIKPMFHVFAFPGALCPPPGHGSQISDFLF